MSIATLYYTQISDTPSDLIQKILNNETTLQAGGSYLVLGFVGRKDAIVVVDSEGAVVTLPYDQDSFIMNIPKTSY